MKRPMIWIAVLVLGQVMVAVALTPLLGLPQCPPFASRMPDGSQCIIGANMLPGLVWEAGILVAFVGAVGSLVSLSAILWESR